MNGLSVINQQNYGEIIYFEERYENFFLNLCEPEVLGINSVKTKWKKLSAAFGKLFKKFRNDICETYGEISRKFSTTCQVIFVENFVKIELKI